MLAGDGARPADGRADAEAMNKESPAREPCVRRNRLLLKGSHAIIIKGLRFCGHGRKLLFMVEITLPLAAMVENQYITTTRVENEYYWSKIDVYYSLRSKITQAGYPWTYWRIGDFASMIPRMVTNTFSRSMAGSTIIRGSSPSSIWINGRRINDRRRRKRDGYQPSLLCRALVTSMQL